MKSKMSGHQQMFGCFDHKVYGSDDPEVGGDQLLLHIEHYTLKTANSTLHTAHCTLHTAHFTLHTGTLIITYHKLLT